MAQTSSYEIANDSGAVVRGRLNEVFSAIQSSNAGATAPTNTAPGMLWLDTSVSPGVLKRRNSANTDWLSVDEKVPDPQDDTDTDAYVWAVGDVQGAVIIESDSNANGRFVKYSDGTMICHNNDLATPSQGFTWTFPAAFVEVPAIVGNVITSLPRITTNGSATNTTVQIYVHVSDTGNVSTLNTRQIAIGRWK